jgi:DNA-binding transcriptional LysR family regulator
MNLSDVYVFKKVASTLSFTKAARQIGVSRSAVSKQVNRLEQDLGVVLINRTTRSVNLTEAGRSFDSNTSAVDKTIERAADLVRGADMSPLGTVSFTLPSGLGSALMPGLITQFQPCWPELRLNIQFDDRNRCMIAENLDLAIMISKRLTDSSLISRRLARTRKVLAASPRYLRAHGNPQSPSELKSHRCLGIGSAVKSGTIWKLREGDRTIDVPTTFAFSTNNNLALILAACLDSGIIYIPEICIAGELARNQLQIIPGCVDPEPYGIYALYPHRNAAAKVKVLVDFIENMLQTVASLDRWAPLTDRVTDLPETECIDAQARDRTHVA